MAICKKKKQPNKIVSSSNDKSLFENSVQSIETLHVYFRYLIERLTGSEEDIKIFNFYSNYITNIKNSTISRTVALKFLNISLFENPQNLKLIIETKTVDYAYKLIKRDKEGLNRKYAQYFNQYTPENNKELVNEATLLFKIIQSLDFTKNAKEEKHIKKLLKKLEKNKIQIPVYTKKLISITELECDFTNYKKELINLFENDEGNHYRIDFIFSTYNGLLQKIKEKTYSFLVQGEYKRYLEFLKNIEDENEIKIRYDSHIATRSITLKEQKKKEEEKKEELNSKEKTALIERKSKFMMNAKFFEEWGKKQSNDSTLKSVSFYSVPEEGTKEHRKRRQGISRKTASYSTFNDYFEINEELKGKKSNEEEIQIEENQVVNENNETEKAIEKVINYENTTDIRESKELLIGEEMDETQQDEPEKEEEEEDEEKEISRESARQKKKKKTIKEEEKIDDYIEEYNIESLHDQKENIKVKERMLEEQEFVYEEKSREETEDEVKFTNGKIKQENINKVLNELEETFKEEIDIQEKHFDKESNQSEVDEECLWNNLIKKSNFYNVKEDFLNYYEYKKKQKERNNEIITLGDLLGMDKHLKNQPMENGLTEQNKCLNTLAEQSKQENWIDIETKKLNEFNNYMMKIMNHIDINTKINNTDVYERRSFDENIALNRNNKINNTNLKIQRKEEPKEPSYAKYFTKYDNLKYIQQAILKDNGSLYEDDQIQIQIEHLYYGVEGLVKFYITNKKKVNYYDVEIQICNEMLFPLTFHFLRRERNLNFSTTNCYELAVHCSNVYKGLPTLRISFRMQDMLKRSIDLRLPIGINKFMKKMKIPEKIFQKFWNNTKFERYSREKIILKNPNLSHDSIIKNSCLGRALDVCFNKDNKIYICGCYTGNDSEENDVILVCVEEIKNKKLKIVCKSNNPTLPSSILFLLLLLLKHHGIQ